jgi:hypothetical protein
MGIVSASAVFVWQDHHGQPALTGTRKLRGPMRDVVSRKLRTLAQFPGEIAGRGLGLGRLPAYPVGVQMDWRNNAKELSTLGEGNVPQ